MPNAEINIDLGKEKDPKDYIDIISKDIRYKRSNVKVSGRKNLIRIRVSASDPRALLASINSVLKQLRIVSNMDKMLNRLNAGMKK